MGTMKTQDELIELAVEHMDILTHIFDVSSHETANTYNLGEGTLSDDEKNDIDALAKVFYGKMLRFRDRYIKKFKKTRILKRLNKGGTP